jgi:tryptophan synthase alpha chain
MIFLITPQTSESRIRAIEAASSTFIYMVSSSSTTGSTAGFSESNMAYFKRIADMNLSVETLVGFGIADAHTFSQASQYSRGAIIGSAFIRHLEERGTEHIAEFINALNAKHV